METLKGKKLLFLGGSAIMADPVIQAKKMGIYTIVTDLHDMEKAPAKRVADEYWDISLMDDEKLVPLIKERKIDGILTGFTDAFLLPYQHLCELTELPCYGTKETFEITKDKAKFKQLCRDNGVPIIPEYDLASFDPSVITDGNKVIVKPVDNSGSNGVILCEKPKDFEKCLEFALSFSAKKKVIIEKYMEMDSISLSYTIQDGVVSLSTTDDRYVHKGQRGGSVTCMGLYPSKYTDAYIEKIDPKVRKMYESAGLKNGVLALQFFTNGKEFYVMEMGFRLSGGQHYTYTKWENNISALEQLIHFALTGRMADFNIAEKDNPRFRNTYCHLFILGREGKKIAKIEGYEFLTSLPEVQRVDLMKNVGDTIGKDGTTSQKMAGLHLKVRDIAHLAELMCQIQQNFHVLDESGNELVLELGK